MWESTGLGEIRLGILEVQGLSKEFDGVKAVDGLSCEIQEGSITALIGPNGAGKTTVFNLVTGFLRQDKGDVIFKGKRITYKEPGYAPELNPDEFVWNHLKRQGVSKTPLRKDESLRSRVQSDLANIQSRPALVRSFFHAPTVAYTRD